jgi:hypothetical protein
MKIGKANKFKLLSICLTIALVATLGVSAYTLWRQRQWNNTAYIETIGDFTIWSDASCPPKLDS